MFICMYICRSMTLQMQKQVLRHLHLHLYEHVAVYVYVNMPWHVHIHVHKHTCFLLFGLLPKQQKLDTKPYQKGDQPKNWRAPTQKLAVLSVGLQSKAQRCVVDCDPSDSARATNPRTGRRPIHPGAEWIVS